MKWKMYLPADGIELFDVAVHVFVDVVSINDWIDFEGDAVVPAPAPDSLQTGQVLISVLTFTFAGATANQLVGLWLETVTRNGQNVQIFSYDRRSNYYPVNYNQ